MIKSKSSDYQDLLKVIAVIIMIIDHIGASFFCDATWLRIVGRFGISIWFFFAGYNYRRPKFLLLYLGLVLSYICYVTSGNSTLNMLVTFYLGQCYLYLMEKFHQDSNRDILIHCVLMMLLTPFTYSIFEYGTLPVAFMIAAKHHARSEAKFPFLIPLTIATMFLTYISFRYFSNLEMFFAFCSIAMGSLSLVLKSPETQVPINLSVISRHTLLIYFLQVSSFAIIATIMRLAL